MCPQHSKPLPSLSSTTDVSSTSLRQQCRRDSRPALGSAVWRLWWGRGRRDGPQDGTWRPEDADGLGWPPGGEGGHAAADGPQDARNPKHVVPVHVRHKDPARPAATSLRPPPRRQSCRGADAHSCIRAGLKTEGACLVRLRPGLESAARLLRARQRWRRSQGPAAVGRCSGSQARAG